MKKILTLASLVCANFLANGQAVNLLSPRLLVNTPATITGIKQFTYSHGTSSGAWGRDLDSTWLNVELVKVATDSLGCATPLTTVVNKWVLIYRGNCQFSEKAYNAQLAGAKGVIIVNNQAHAPLVNMSGGTNAASVTIPVLFISKEDGDLINNQLRASQQVLISVSKWGFNQTHDLAFVPRSTSLPPYFAIPTTQVGSPAQYRNYTGGILANTGNSTETNVKIISTVSFTPTGGATSVVRHDTVTKASFAVADSIAELFSPNSYVLPVTSTGRYDYVINASSDNAETITIDNKDSFSTYVTSNTFSKGRYDVANNKPLATGGYKLGGSGGPMVWGPLYYVTKGNGFKADSAQFTVVNTDTSKKTLDGGDNVNVWLFKWTDANNDSLIQVQEIQAKGVATRPFTSNDSNYTIINAPFFDAEGNVNQVPLEDNQWYWVAADVSDNFFLGVDNDINYFSRSYAAFNFASPKFRDYWAPQFAGDKNALDVATGTDTLSMFPFIANKTYASNIDSVSFNSAKGLVPAIAFKIGTYNAGVKNVSNAFNMSVYPVPATEVLNVKFDLPAASKKVTISVSDAYGRTIFKEVKNNVKEGNYSINTSSFASGQYYLLVTTDNNVRWTPFTVLSK